MTAWGLSKDSQGYQMHPEYHFQRGKPDANPEKAEAV
jgi:hypothetical protein